MDRTSDAKEEEIKPLLLLQVMAIIIAEKRTSYPERWNGTGHADVIAACHAGDMATQRRSVFVLTTWNAYVQYVRPQTPEPIIRRTPVDRSVDSIPQFPRARWLRRRFRQKAGGDHRERATPRAPTRVCVRTSTTTTHDSRARFTPIMESIYPARAEPT
jgi:hypothetical protein